MTAPFPLKITPRIMEFLLYCKFDSIHGSGKQGLILWDGAPPSSEDLQCQEPFSQKEISDAATNAAAGKGLPADPMKGSVPPEIHVQFMLSCYRNILNGLAWVGGHQYDADPDLVKKI